MWRGNREEALWVREHSCPAYRFELDRDWNAVARNL